MTTKRKPQKPRSLQLYVNGKLRPRSCYSTYSAAIKGALYFAWHAFPGEVLQLIDRRSGRVVTEMKATERGVSTK